jgi:Ca2+-binding RTX toxin-like protein
MRASAITITAVGLALLLPGAAAASTAAQSGTQIVVNASGGEANSIFIAHNPAGAGSYTIFDSARVTALAPCMQAANTIVTCPDGTVTTIFVNAGNRNDSVQIDELTVPPTVRTGLDGDQGRDLLLGGAGADTMTGDQNDDSLDGRRGPDTFSGGAGRDTANYGAHSAGVSLTVATGADDGNFDDLNGDNLFGDLETIVGTIGDDLIVGDASNEDLFGLDGDDSMFGNLGADTVAGGPDDDRVIGNAGADLVNGKSGFDILKGKKGNDRLKARDGQRDAKINCGSGRRESAKADRRDPNPKSC